MVRLLATTLLLLVLPQTTAVESSRDPLRPYVDRKFQTALRAVQLVRLRFELATAAGPCRGTENLFGYRLLLDQFPAGEQAMIKTAEIEGRDQGGRRVIPSGQAPACAAALRNLYAADNELLVLAERAEHND